MAIELAEATPESEDQAIAALMLAFIRDPVLRWIYPAPQRYLEHFPRFAQLFGGRAFEARGAWRSDDGGSAALWLPPGVHADGEAMGEHLLSTVSSERRDTLEEILEEMDEYHPQEPHWYLAIIGVDAAHQGKGLGAQLLDVALRRCDEEGVMAYLESSNPANISLYERHGFEVVHEIRKGDAPGVFPMVRPARS